MTVIGIEGKAHICCQCCLAHFCFRQFGVDMQYKMRTGVAFGYLRNSGQRRSVDGSQNFVALLAVVVFHFVDMTFKIAFGNKACQRILLEAGYGAAVKAHGLLIALQKTRRQHHVADAQRGHKAF